MLLNRVTGISFTIILIMNKNLIVKVINLLSITSFQDIDNLKFITVSEQLTLALEKINKE